MQDNDPFESTTRRPHVEGLYSFEEVQLANRNCGILLEALRHDVTPIGLHYLLNHFDVPYVADERWQLDVAGLVDNPGPRSLADIKTLPARTLTVTLECAGNGRGLMAPRYPSMPWGWEAVSTAQWTGIPLRHLLERAGLSNDVVEIAFIGADCGFDSGREHNFGRSLSRDAAMADDVLLVWAMNGQPLPPPHGFPLRLIVPGWYGMASVKWLTRIEALGKPYDGFQQVAGYHYRSEPDGPRKPVSHMRVKSLLVPPGIPDWYTRRRLVDAGVVTVQGRAWSGDGVPIAKVDFAINGVWHPTTLEPPLGKFAWRGWRAEWDASQGEYELCCRATDANGATQPSHIPWDATGFGNNALHRVRVNVR